MLLRGVRGDGGFTSGVFPLLLWRGFMWEVRLGTGCFGIWGSGGRLCTAMYETSNLHSINRSMSEKRHHFSSPRVAGGAPD